MKLLIDWDGGSTVVNPGKPFVIGRDKSADIQVVGSKVSRTHLRLEFTGTHWKAVQVLGTPNTLTYGSSVTSWSLPVNDMVTPPDPQWITVGFYQCRACQWH